MAKKSSGKFNRKIGAELWWNGKFHSPEKAQVSLFTHTLHYGLGVFEGIRAYRLKSGKLGIFKLEEHIDRLFDSCKICEIKIPYSKKDLMKACSETVKRSGLKDNVYIRPLVWIGEGPLGVFPTFDPPIEVAIMTWEWGAYLGDEAKKKGARIKVSSFSRGWVNSQMTKSKMVGGYTTGILAKLEIKRSGYDEALLLDVDGYVAEGSGENIFMIKNNIIKTTPLSSILNGITRATIIELAKERGLEVIEQRFTRDELYCADEVFFTGTAAELTPIREIDDRMIGKGSAGPNTLYLARKYEDVVRGASAKHAKWITTV